MSRGCGTRSPALRAECRLRESQNLLLRKIFGQERGNKRSLQKIKYMIMTVAILCISYNIVRVTKDRRARRVGMCTRLSQKRKHTEYWLGNLKDGYQLKHLEVKEKIILK